MDVANAAYAAPIGRKEQFSAKESIQKKTARCRLLPVLLTFIGGLSKETSCPFDNTRYPYRVPNGLSPINAPMLGAAEGN